jgi:hypothetical protein
MLDRQSNAAHRLRHRWLYALCGVLVIVLGLGSRSDLVPLPAFVAKYGGDALWALLVFLGFGFLFPRLSTLGTAGLALAFSCAIEFSQLYRAPWFDALRRNRFGALVLGDTFAWADIAAYAVGIAFGACVEWVVLACRVRRNPGPHSGIEGQ